MTDDLGWPPVPEAEMAAGLQLVPATTEKAAALIGGKGAVVDDQESLEEADKCRSPGGEEREGTATLRIKPREVGVEEGNRKDRIRKADKAGGVFMRGAGCREV